MPALDRIFQLLREIDEDHSCLPRSYIYNEGWMLRLVLDLASRNLIKHEVFTYDKEVRWASEARLSTPFNRARGRCFEGSTLADGVVGDFEWAPGTRALVRLTREANVFHVFEAKLPSKLSSRVGAANGYDQAVRNVACMAQALALNNQRTCARVGFFVVAPSKRIQRGEFSAAMHPDSMREKINQRIEQFSGQGREELSLWKELYFEPFLDSLIESNTLRCLSWEEIIDCIEGDVDCKNSINEFYKSCYDTTEESSAVTLKRGMWCNIEGDTTGARVVVCYVDKKSSRVFVPNSSEISKTVPNAKLKPDGQYYSFSIPATGETRVFEGVQVRILGPGPCRSRIKFEETTQEVRLVDNHLLQSIQ